MILIGIEKAFDKILTRSNTNLNDKTPRETGIEGTFLNLIKDIYTIKQNKTLQPALTLNGEKLHAFPLRSGIR